MVRQIINAAGLVAAVLLLLAAVGTVRAGASEGAELRSAAETAQAQILNAFLDAGGDRDVQNRDGSTPLRPAALFPNFEPDSQTSVHVLLNHRADPDRADRMGRTPLHLFSACSS